MKKKMNIAIWLFTVMMMMMTSCDSMTGDEGLTEDEQLMQNIENASMLESVSFNELPSTAQSTLSLDYSDSDAEEIMKANGLGYRVTMRRYNGLDFGETADVYFNSNGRELHGNGKDGQGRRGPRGHRPPRDRFDGFEFVYPITVTMPDASTIEGNSKEEMRDAIKAWYDANPDTDRKDRPEIVYPLDIILEDETVLTVNSREELLEAVPRKPRGPKGHRPRVFEFVYPISYTMPDASVISGDTKEELWEAIKVWHDANPDSDERGTLNFPVDIEFIDETVVTVNDKDELKATVKAWIEANKPQ